MLDYIVERKRQDDFCSSIIDGRFGEQKVSQQRQYQAIMLAFTIETNRLFSFD